MVNEAKLAIILKPFSDFYDGYRADNTYCDNSDTVVVACGIRLTVGDLQKIHIFYRNLIGEFA